MTSYIAITILLKTLLIATPTGNVVGCLVSVNGQEFPVQAGNCKDKAKELADDFKDNYPDKPFQTVVDGDNWNQI